MSAASRHFGVPVTTIQTWRDNYRKLIKQRGVNPATILSMPKQETGRPLLLPDNVDFRVRKHLTAIREAGSIVNRRVAIATGIGCDRAMRPSLLPVHGGSLSLGRGWAVSILRRIGFVKLKGTKAARKVPEKFESLKTDFLAKVQSVCTKHKIPASLVLNMDETALPIIPVSSWTLAEKGSSQVPIVGLEDKRQITAVLACSASGSHLPPQLLYQG